MELPRLCRGCTKSGLPVRMRISPYVQRGPFPGGCRFQRRSSHRKCVQRLYKSPIFFATLLHAERVQHLRPAFEADRLTLLPDSESGEKDGYDPTLSERKAIVGMACHLEYKLSVAALEEELTSGRPPDRQAAENE